MARWLALALLGSLLCTVCDHVHVACDVLAYEHPIFWSQAWWVPVQFAFVSLGTVLAADGVRALFRAPVAPPTARAAISDVLFLVVAWVTSGLGAREPTAVAFVLAGMWLARVVRGRPAWHVACALIAAAAGSLVEHAMTVAGLFHHCRQDFLTVPRWLPTLYLHAGLLGATLSGWFARRAAATAARA